MNGGNHLDFLVRDVTRELALSVQVIVAITHHHHGLIILVITRHYYGLIIVAIPRYGLFIVLITRNYRGHHASSWARIDVIAHLRCDLR